MSFSEIAKRVSKLALDNSPVILTAIGVTGALTTAYLTGRASFKAAEIIRREEGMQQLEDCRVVPLDTKEKVRLTWQLYIPAAGSAVATIAAIICANRIGSRRAAALAAAYSLAEKGFDEYREKITEKLGAKKERDARDEIAQDRLNNYPLGDRQVIITGSGNHLCYDIWSDRYFRSDMESLKQAVNAVNYQLMHDYSATLTDFYGRIGLGATQYSDAVGWNSDRLLDIHFGTGLSDNQEPCITIDMKTPPTHRFDQIN